MKKHVNKLLLFSLVIMMGFMSGCANSEIKDENLVEDVTLNAYYSDWPPDMLTLIAQEKGYFKENKVDVNLIWVDGITSTLDIRKAGDLDIWSYTLLDFMTEYSEKIEQEAQVFLVEDFSNGADAVIIMDDSDIKTVSDLKGKKIGVEVMTIGEFFLKILLLRENLSFNDIEIVDINFNKVLESLQNGDIDAGVTYEPVISEAKAGGGKVLVDSSQEKGVIVDVYCANKDHIANHPNAYKAFIKSIIQAGEFLNNNPDEAAELIMEPLGMTKEEVIEVFTSIILPNLRENQTAFDRSSAQNSLYTLGRLAQQYLEEQNEEFVQFDIEPLINGELINEIKN